MSSADFSAFKSYARLYGLPGQRAEAQRAIIGTYLGRLLDGKLYTDDLIPSFAPPVVMDWEQTKAFLGGKRGN